MKILLFSCVWKRPEITHAFFDGLERLMESCPYELIPFIVWSEKEHGAEAAKRCFPNCYAKNDPLGEKHNEGLQDALVWFDFDYMMQMGSDNFLNDNIWSLYAPFFESKTPIFGLSDHTVYEPSTGNCKYFNFEDTWGAARCIRKDLIEPAAWYATVRMRNTYESPTLHKTFKDDCTAVQIESQYDPLSMEIIEKHFWFWPPDINKGLDGKSEANLFLAHRVRPKQIRGGDVLWDIKSDVNINSLELVHSAHKGINVDISKSNYPPEIERFI